MVRFIETESRMVVAEGWRQRGHRGCCLTGSEFQVCKMKSVLEVDGGDDSTTI